MIWNPQAEEHLIPKSRFKSSKTDWLLQAPLFSTFFWRSVTKLRFWKSKRIMINYFHFRLAFLVLYIYLLWNARKSIVVTQIMPIFRLINFSSQNSKECKVQIIPYLITEGNLSLPVWMEIITHSPLQHMWLLVN